MRRIPRNLQLVCATLIAGTAGFAPSAAQATDPFGSAAQAWVMRGPPCASDPDCTLSRGGLVSTASVTGGPGLPGSATAHADLGTGLVSVAVSSPGVHVEGGGQMAVSASALVWDTLKFSGAAPGDRITLTMSGNWSLVGDGRAYAYNALALLSDITAVTDVYGAPVGGLCSDAINCNLNWWWAGSGSTTMAIDGLGGNVSTWFQQPSVAQALPGPAYSVQQSFAIYNDVPMILFLSIAANVCVHGGYDCAPSSSFISDPLRLDLPAGVSFTTASGSLAISPVPEPASAALWLAGLGLLCAGVRRGGRALA